MNRIMSVVMNETTIGIITAGIIVAVGSGMHLAKDFEQKEQEIVNLKEQLNEANALLDEAKLPKVCRVPSSNAKEIEKALRLSFTGENLK